MKGGESNGKTTQKHGKVFNYEKWMLDRLPCSKKINPAHIEGCWHLGFRVTVSSIEKLDEAIDKFVYYNCNGELGNHVSFYKK